MVGSVLAVYLLVRQQLRLDRGSIGPRHIQFVSVCLIVPTILILGLEQWLSRETTATLIGGLTGYLLSGLGKYEPSKDGGGDTTKSQEPSPGTTPTPPGKIEVKTSDSVPAVAPPVVAPPVASGQEW